MTRKILAISLIPARNRGKLAGITPETWAKLSKELEPSVLVLLSLTLQVILTLISNQRKRTNNVVIRIIIWFTYMVADPVATVALGVISTNLRDALKFSGSLDASIELATFWAPFLLLHLGGADTITALGLQDNEMWWRHFSHLIVETVLASYIFVRVVKRSRLSVLSAMMLVAGVIKYVERTLSLRNASYSRRRCQGQLVHSHNKSFRNQPDPVGLLASPSKIKNYEELVATKMFQNTERMFADAVLQEVQKNSSCKIIVQKASSTVVSKLIEMELDLMYENLFTKATVTRSRWGYAFRFISFLLILITLISFSISALHDSYEYSPFQLSVTFLLFMAVLLVEVYGAFVVLTSCRTISWLGENCTSTSWLWQNCRIISPCMNAAAKAMKSLSSLRSPRWSNSMGQYSLIKRYLRQEPNIRCRKVRKLTYINIMRNDEVLWFVYKRPVKYYVKEGIHQYLNKAEDTYHDQQFSILTSKGRVPWKTYAKVDPIATGFNSDDINFDDIEEFGEMVMLWHIVTEVCYYLDRDSLVCEKYKSFQPPEVYRDWKTSKYLSRYLMQLYVVSSDMLPPRHPLPKEWFYEENVKYWGSIFNVKCWDSIFKFDSTNNNPGETSNPEQAKHRRRRDKVQACKLFCSGLNIGKKKERGDDHFHILAAAIKLLDVLLDVDGGAPANAPNSKLHAKWKLLSEIWIELLASTANRCRSKEHAKHLRRGGELLTHVWVLLGHFGLTEHPRW